MIPKSDIVSLLTVCKVWDFIIVKILYYRPHIGKRIQLDLFLRSMKLDSKDIVFNYRLMIKRLNFHSLGKICMIMVYIILLDVTIWNV